LYLCGNKKSKKAMKRLFSLFTLLVFSLTLIAQTKATRQADALFAQGNFRQAASAYGNLARSAERSKRPPAFELSHVYNRLGESHLNLREYAQAEAAFVKARENGARDIRFLINFGDVFLANNKAQQALDLFQQALTENPEHIEAQDRVRRAQFHIASANNPNIALHPVALETALNTPTNNQTALAWYRGNLLFTSDRSAPRGSKKPAARHFFHAQAIYDFEQNRISGWNPIQPLRNVKASAPDHSFAFDRHTQTYYVMRCPNPPRGRARSCNIFAYRMD